MTTVEVLLQEFYHPNTSSARRLEVERSLLAFQSQPDSWQLCLRVAMAPEATENQILWSFSTSTVQHTITWRWAHLTAADKTMLREALWNTYVQLGAPGAASRHRDTLAHLIVLMGKREFPEQDPDYMQRCMVLTKTRFKLGINLLRITSEEVVSNRGDLPTEWKQNFVFCISICLPDVLDLVTKYLLTAVCHVSGKDIQSFIPNTFIDFSLASALPNDSQFSSSTLELLGCAQHLVSWIRTELIPEHLLMSILDLCQWRPANEPISLAALSVLNELFYLQKPLPHAGTLMGGVRSLLELHNSNGQPTEMYSEKFREVLRRYTAKYSGKLMQEPNLLYTFLNLLWGCTTGLHGALDFAEKLMIWTPLIEGIAQDPEKISRFNHVLTQLVDEIMRRTLFETNKSELEVLNNELTEANSSATEWQQFLDQCFEFLALLASTCDVHFVFLQVFVHWLTPQTYLMSLQNGVENDSRSSEAANTGEILRDIATVFQAAVRLASLMDTSASQLQMLSNSLLQMLQFLASNRWQGFNEMENVTLQVNWNNLYAQLLLATRSIFRLSKATVAEELLHGLIATLGSILECSGSVSGASPIVQQAASELLLFVSTEMRPKCLLEIPQIQSLLQAGSRLGAVLPRQVTINVHISLVSYMVLPWKGVPEQQQEYQHRHRMLGDYVQGLAQNFLDLDLGQANEGEVAVTMDCLFITFIPLMENFKATGLNAKNMLVSTLEPTFNKALEILDRFGVSSDAMAIAVAEFSLSMLRVFPTCLSAPSLEAMITLFITAGGGWITPGKLVIFEKVLQMVQPIVEQPGSRSLDLLTAILDIILNILPLLQQPNAPTDNSEISSLIYTLFDSLLTWKWKDLDQAYLRAILNAYGKVLVSGRDHGIVRSVLVSMQKMNERNRLYNLALFKEEMLASFQQSLIDLIMSSEGALLVDIIAETIYAMGQVDRRQMLESFAQAALPVAVTALEEICQTGDIATFTQKLAQLRQDVHCAHLNETAKAKELAYHSLGSPEGKERIQLR